MKDHVEIGYLTKFSGFRVNIDQVMDTASVKSSFLFELFLLILL